MVDFKALAVAFFYNYIKGIVEGFLSGFIGGMPADLIMAVIGYYLATRTSYRWLGEGLLFGAVTSFGMSGGLALTAPQAQKAQASTGVKW